MVDKRIDSPPPLRAPPCLIRPGVDLTEMKQQPCPSRVLPPFQLMPQTAALVDYCVSPKIPKELDHNNNNKNKEETKRLRHLLDGEIIDANRKKVNDEYITDNGDPITLQAYANFELARKMHQNNLDHQPLPDCVTDAAYRKLEMTKQCPGLALDVEPIATGIGIKKYKAGPHHCTKMKVYRPKTANVGKCVTSKMTPMDLAICWDYVPAKEPPAPKHIDGSSESGEGPAVFTCVQSSPSKQQPESGGKKSSSNPVFNNTSGEMGFFEKDVLRKKLDFAGKPIENIDKRREGDPVKTMGRCESVHRKDHHHHHQDFHYDYDFQNQNHKHHMDRRFGKQYQSSPDIFQEDELKSLRRKYLGEKDVVRSCCHVERHSPLCRHDMITENGTGNGNTFLRRARARFCSKVGPEPNRNCCVHDQPETRNSYCPRLDRIGYHLPTVVQTNAFRIGRPHYSADGTLGLHSVANGCCSCSLGRAQKVLVVPRPRQPYSKKSYNINTLVPPFKCKAGGAKEGGYPEHWRLASVYQHAYKPIAQRKYPLMQTVYK